MFNTKLLPLLALPSLGVSTLVAQTASVPTREIGSVEASSTEPFKNIFSVRSLTGGRVLLNDGVRRQLVILDSALAVREVLLDSVVVGAQGYGPRASPLIPFVADSTLFVDAASLSLLVIDPAGRVSRVMSLPKASDFRFVAASSSGADARGNLIYQGARDATVYAQALPGAPAPSLPPQPDSAPILRASFSTRMVDTVARVRNQLAIVRSGVPVNGVMHVTKFINPVASVDTWAVLSSGTLALVRSHDYHVDWLKPDGTFKATAPMQFDWKRLTDDDKLALVDSARSAERKALSDAKLSSNSSAVTATRSGGTVVPDPTIEFVPLKDMADYVPPLRVGAALADVDDQLWVLPTTSSRSNAGELVYDVIDDAGTLKYRVRLPSNRSIAGFGHAGVIFLRFRDEDAVWHLERRRVLN